MLTCLSAGAQNALNSVAWGSGSLTCPKQTCRHSHPSHSWGQDVLTPEPTASGLEALTFPLTSGLGSVPSTAQLHITGFRKILCKVTSGLSTQILWNSPDMRILPELSSCSRGEGGRALPDPLHRYRMQMAPTPHHFLTLSSLILLLLLPSQPLFPAFSVAATLCLLWTYTVKFRLQVSHVYMRCPNAVNKQNPLIMQIFTAPLLAKSYGSLYDLKAVTLEVLLLGICALGTLSWEFSILWTVPALSFINS